MKAGGAARAWTPEEDERLRKLVEADGLYVSAAAPLLGRTPRAAMARARKLGLRSQDYKNWSHEEEQELRRLAEAGEDLSTAAKILGRTEGAVRVKARRMGLLRMKMVPEKERDEPKNAETGTLCWRCENAVPDPERGTGCPWSISGKPVDGWDAVRTFKSGAGDCYYVRACPGFEPDRPREAIRVPYEAYRRLMEEW